jgi:hypothetical protein
MLIKAFSFLFYVRKNTLKILLGKNTLYFWTTGNIFLAFLMKK